ncbi:RDD family protein [Actinomadura algeriensis]|uniref:RDD family membrane protein YckC n=1 Tax=Actinomadura algeriensis TaxID=1679523 RepID=A0ABR9JLV6_9ACTN|nr:RDD family protein [Actinomadura algeriensis]MBE1531408.1 putative RDD family membrane protein YckC [Actinomadura algeriensis]
MGQLVTGEAVALDIRVARLASRGCALLIDLLLQFAILNIALYVASVTALVADEAWAIGLSLLMTVAVLVGYPCAAETLTRGRTLGKMALGLRVVGDDGGPVRFRQALVRALAGFIEFWTLYGSPALIASFCNRRGKRLGDMFAGTVVIQERSGSGLYRPVAVMPAHLMPWARTLELSMLSDELAMTARQYLSRFWELRTDVRDSLGQRIAGDVAAVISPPPPPGVRPEIMLSAVLAERRHREQWRLAERRARRMRRLGMPAYGPAARPAPVMAMAGPPPGPGAGPQGPPAPPPFSAPQAGRPAFLPPPNYGSGPYAGYLNAPPGPPGPPGPPAPPYPYG